MIMRTFTVIFLSLFLMRQSYAQEEMSPEDLAQAIQNPLAKLISVPIQNNFSFDATQNNEMGYALNIQPVYPIATKHINFVNRAIINIGYAPGIYEGGNLFPHTSPDEGRTDGAWGFGDLNLTTYLSPMKVKKVVWGIGPSITLPTATDNRLGSGKWSIGPSLVLVMQPGKWTVDVIIRQLWSIGGDSERRDVNQFFLQPLIAYNLPNRWAISTLPTITCNWDSEPGQKWMIPLGGGVSKLVMFGKIPTVLMVQYYVNVVKPDLAADSELRIQLNFIFSK